jgi:hypothetical protein
MDNEIHLRFLEDIKNHKAVIELDNGLFRSIKCSNNGSSVYAFRIVTWPGHLCIDGDMGCLVFARTRDMFEFFRGGINHHYWTEKLQAHDGIFEYDHEAFLNYVKEVKKDDKEFDFEEFKAETEDFSSTYQASTYLYDNDISVDWPSFEKHKFHYLWKLYAIQWAIEKYDSIKNST